MKKSAKISRQNKGKKIAKEQLNKVSGGSSTPQTELGCDENGVRVGILGPVGGSPQNAKK
ncbi:hypothetical protein [Legionella clemsonensis]|uniref:Uncharacterized protein n=1 Tax=Legionella clemsonensis TaxID=1867846 RepID=A0A222NYL9_9GAMM|nr:hypothetical protein [Legionella clemsonensis]ASQ44655.1 hypothetical protein clem_00445 [Legionella clemsonensis]